MEEPSSSTAIDVQPGTGAAEEQRKRRPSQRGSLDAEKRQLDGEVTPGSSSNVSVPTKDKVLESPFPDFQVPPQWNAYTAIRELLQGSPDEVALIDSEGSVTRGELLARLKEFATCFQLWNVAAAERVFVCLSNSVTNLLATYAVVCAGGAVILAKASLSEAELHTLMIQSGSMFVLTDHQTEQKMVKATSSIKIRAWFSTGDEGVGVHSLTSFVNRKNWKLQEFPMARPEKCVLAICYTSGATGAPKPVQFTHRAFVANCWSTRQHLDWDSSDVVFSTLDIAELPGLLFPIMSVLSGARCVIASRGVHPRDVYATITRRKVTCLCSTPDEVAALVRSQKPSGSDISLTRVTVSGSRVPGWLNAALFKAFKNFRCLMNLYTVSEAGGLVCVPQASSTKRGSVGVPAPMVKIKVVSLQDGKDLGPNEAGEIYFCSPIATPGCYYKPIQGAAASNADSKWHKTGDVGFYDDQGHLHVIQRVSEMIRCHKGMVAPAHLEDIILEAFSEDVAEVVVFGLSRTDIREAPTAAIVLNEERKSNKGFELAKKIKDTVAEKMGEKMGLYGGVVFFEEIPLTESGKVDMLGLLQQAIHGTPYCAEEYCAMTPNAS